jgi:putative Mn2+ efflux pump MntP
MGLLEIFLIGIGLAMDAFAVSICKGLSMHKMNWKNAVIIALYFGGFQALMPILGYFLGSTFESFVTSIDHWIAFILLLIIGGNMIKESFDNEDEKKNDKIDFKTMSVLAIAFFQVNIFEAASIIGITTFIISLIGVKIGNKFGDKYQNKAEFIGGLILILLGVKVLLEHLGIL